MLPEVVRELAAGHRVSCATLLKFEFLSGTQYFWDGHGYLTAAGNDWLGFGEFISVSGLEHSRGMSAPQATFTLSGVDDNLLAVAVNGAIEATGRPCSVFLQFLTDAGAPLDSPIAVWVGTMDTPTFKVGSNTHQISLSAETLFVDRVRAPFGYMTDTDQRARWSLDRGFEFMASLIFKTVNWLRA